MMTRKRICNKGRKFLAGMLSVLLGLSLYMSYTPFTVYAEDTSEDITKDISIQETENGNYTVTITLKCGEDEADASIYDALTIKENEDSETIYKLTDKKVVLPAGTYYIYLNEKLLSGSKLIVGDGTKTEFEIYYCTISFFNGDQEAECWSIAKGSPAPTDRLAEITLAREGHIFAGWSTAPDVLTPVDWTLPVTEDLIVYAIWEPETPPCEHHYIWCTSADEHWQACEFCGEFSKEAPAPHTFADTWSNDEVSHWHECICGALKDTDAHTASDWIIDKEATLTATGSRHTECTVCKRILQSEDIPKIEPKEIHEHQYSEEWKSDDTHHWHICTSTEGECEVPESDKAEHTFDEGKVTKEATEEAEGEKLYTCTVCGYEKTDILPKLEHKHKFSEEWKSDDTSHWHVCACGTKSEVKPHTAGDWITDKKPTVSAEGSRHQECTVCKKVLKTEAVAKLIAPKITAGVGQIYHPGSGKDLTITCSGSLEDLTGVYVDNGAVHKSNYTVASGSTILTLKSAYLDSLAGGTHTLKLAYSNGTSAETQFTIQKTAAVKTGDTTNYIPLVILLILSGGVLIVTAVIRKRGFNG